MIKIKNIVDSAIEANIHAYKETHKTYRMYRKVWKTAKTRKDINDFRDLSYRYLSELNGIEDTLARIFPDHEDYIKEKLTNAIWYE